MARHAKPRTRRTLITELLAALIVGALLSVLAIVTQGSSSAPPTTPHTSVTVPNTPTNLHPIFKVHVRPTPPHHSAQAHYNVRTGDSLWSIAVAHHTTWQRIYHMNRGEIGSNPNLIHTGEVLRL